MTRSEDRSGDTPGPPAEAEVERLLAEGAARAASAEPRAAFRDACRSAFLAEGAKAKVASQSIAGARSQGSVDRAQNLIESVLRDDPQAPRTEAPSAAFRAACREAFLADAREPAGEVPAAGRPRGRLLRFVAVAAGIAAALLVTLLPPRPRWRLTDVTGEGRIEVAGASLGERERDRLGADLMRGASLRTAEARVDLALDDWLTLRVRDHTELAFERLDGFEQEGVLRLGLQRGEIYLSTRPERTPPGATIEIETLDGVVHVTGTSLGVLRTEELTCVCVARGEVSVDCRATKTTRSVGENASYVISCKPGVAVGCSSFEENESPEHRSHTGELLDFAAQP